MSSIPQPEDITNRAKDAVNSAMSGLPPPEEVPYRAKDAVAPAVKATIMTGTAGLFFSAVQAALTRQNIGAMGTFTRYAGTTTTFAAMGGTYEFFRLASANLREKDDSYNAALGGFIAGSMVGISKRTIPAVVGYGAALSVIMAAFTYTGGKPFGGWKDPREDRYEVKEQLRANKRRPIQETLDELGEGRGVYGPGYDERRRERIKQRYGIDVPPAQ